MKTKKKNRFFTFCFSFFPGAGEMYMGFMKTGVSLMTLFFLCFAAPMFLGLDELVVFAFIVWFYGFFHANHLASLSDEDFAEVKDDFLFGISVMTSGKGFVNKYQKGVAAVLILLGAFLLWNTVIDMTYDILPEAVRHIMWSIGNYIPRVVAGVFIVWAGIKMIQGKKMQIAEGGNSEAADGSGAVPGEAEAMRSGAVPGEAEAMRSEATVVNNAGEGNTENREG